MIMIYSYGGKTYLFVDGVECCVDTAQLAPIVEAIKFELLKQGKNKHAA